MKLQGMCRGDTDTRFWQYITLGGPASQGRSCDTAGCDSLGTDRVEAMILVFLQGTLLLCP